MLIKGKKGVNFIKTVRKRYIIWVIILLIIILSIMTNPTKEEYLQYSEEQSGIAPPPSLEIERINFYLFSTYASKLFDHYGIVHLGFMGNFFQISEGQFDYPWWLEFFN